MATGIPAVAGWAGKKMADELHKLSLSLCANADKVAAQLRAKGAKLPKQWDSFSCDQKIAFLAAFAPWGPVALIAGALVGAAVTNAAAEVEKGWDAASKALTDVSKKLGVSVPDVSLPKVGGTAGSIAKKVFGQIGGVEITRIPPGRR